MKSNAEGTHRACHFTAEITADEGARGYQIETDLQIGLTEDAKARARRSFDRVSVDEIVSFRSTLTGVRLTPRQARERAARLAQRRIDALLD